MKSSIFQGVSRYRALDHSTKVLITAFLSSLLNAAVGVGKVLLGLIFLSPWYIINGIYYLILCVARGFSLRRFAICHEETISNDRKIFIKSGAFLIVLGFSYLLVSIRMFFRSDATHFPPYIVFLVVIVSLMKLCFGIRGIFYSRKENNDVVKVIRIYSMADAGVSIVMTRCALLLIANAADAVRYSSVFGMVVSAAIMITGILMCICRTK